MAAMVARLERQGETMDAHMRDCARDNAAKLKKMVEIEKKVDHLDERFEAVDKLLAWAGRGVGAIVVAVITAAVSVLAQGYIQHQQVQATASQAVVTAADAATTAQQVNQKLDQLLANRK
jgi:hypothetical protein